MIAGIIGATGFAGAELARILRGHPRVDALALSSTSYEGAAFSSVYPNFAGIIDARLEKSEEVISRADALFAALPNGAAEPYAAAAVRRGIPFIDLSADFRFDRDEASYEAWYGKPYDTPALHEHSVYGLCELNRERLRSLSKKTARGKDAPLIIGNPGCYPTCASLAAWPALAKGAAAEGAVIVDAASGITGGGREPQRSFHFPECSDSVSAYKVGAHRHTPEIARNFSVMAADGGARRRLLFTPHLAPLNRGILATVYLPLTEEYRLSGGEDGAPRPPTAAHAEKTAALRELYASFYAGERFVRVLGEGINAATNRVRGSNYCDMSVHLDASGSTLIICAAIDNMVKGAAGQAVQNMNILFDFDEASGLEYKPAFF
jgi:N-acetyl-gamma-glutamyl-phosphate reductase